MTNSCCSSGRRIRRALVLSISYHLHLFIDVESALLALDCLVGQLCETLLDAVVIDIILVIVTIENVFHIVKISVSQFPLITLTFLSE